MANEQVKQDVTSGFPTMDVNFEEELLASRLVSEVRKSPDHVSFTLTGFGVLAFAKAMRLSELEERQVSKLEEKTSVFPDADNELVSKSDVIKGLRVTHTTLWKWEKTGYLKPVRVGKRVYYRRDDIKALSRKGAQTNF